MSTRAKRWLSATAMWGLPVVVYLCVAIPVAVNLRDKLNPDAVPYVRLAKYMLEGRVWASVSGHWSALLPATMTPFVAAGMDPVYAARAALVIWGMGYLVAAQAFLGTFVRWDWGWRCAVGCALGVIVVPRATRIIAPDIVLSACLFAYFASICSERALREKKWQSLAGLIGGVAYLAKSYALPFLVLHVPFTFLLRQRAVGDAAKSSLIVAVGVLVIAGPWIGLMSAKYGKLSVSPAGPLAHAVVHPPERMLTVEDERREDLRQATLTGDPHIVANENPETGVYLHWSPFDDRASYVHQLRLVRDHAIDAMKYLAAGDALWLGPLAAALAVIAMLGWIRPPMEWWRVAWVIGSCAIYCSGFMLVWFEARYVDTLFTPLAMVLCIAFLQAWIGSPRMRAAVGAVVLAGFLWPAGWEIRELLAPGNARAGVYREVATLIELAGLRGPIATSDRYAGSYVALYNDEKLIVIPPTSHPATDRAIAEASPQIILIWREPENDVPEWEARLEASRGQARQLARKLRYIPWLTYRKHSRVVEVYAPRDAGSTKPQAATTRAGS